MLVILLAHLISARGNNLIVEVNQDSQLNQQLDAVAFQP